MGQAAPFAFRMSVSAAGPTPAIPNRTTLRREIEEQIERLIAALDMMDGDTDLEPMFAGHVNPAFGDEAEEDEDEEPSLGWTIHGGHGRPDAPGLFGEDREEDTSDEEPSLGWPERRNQIAAAGGTDDREREPREASWS